MNTNRRVIKKTYRATLLLTALIFLLACGKSETSETVTLRWWQFWADPYVKPVIAELIADFEKQNPGITIDMTELTWSNGHEKIVTGFASGRAPDVLELGSDWVPEFVHRNALLDVTTAVDSIRTDFLGWEPLKANGKTFGFPWLLGSRILFFNNTLLQKNGLTAGKHGTWEEFLQAVKSINDPKNGIYGFGTTAKEPHQLYKKILPFFWQNGGSVLNKDWTASEINSPQNLEALRFYLELSNHGVLESQKMLDQKFVQGKIGFVISGGWLIKMLEDQDRDFAYGASLMPAATQGGTRSSFAGGEYLVINKNTNHPAAAIRFVKFLLEPDNAMKICRASRIASPAAKTAASDPFFRSHPLDSVLVAQLAVSQMPPMHPDWLEIERIIEDEIELAVYKQKTARQALDDAHRKINKILQKAARNTTP